MQPVTFTPAASASSHRVPALERRQQRRVRVHDAVREGVVDRLLEDRAEPGHRDEIDLVALERVDDLVGVGDPVEVGPERSPRATISTGTPPASAIAVAPHGRSTSTTTIGSPASSMARRIVPLPDASTPIRLTS